MRVLAIAVVVLLASLASLACSNEATKRCRAACDRADECAEDVKDPNFKFDKGECVAACTFLEKDEKGKELVTAHVECLETAKTCAAVNACD